MNKEDIVKLIDGIPFYRYEYADFLYQQLEEKDKEINRLNNIINKLEKYLIECGVDDEIMECCDLYDINGIDLRNKLKELKEGK